MSAIAGIYYLDEQTVDSADLVRMIDILAHRGPDGWNIWSEGAIGFGHLSDQVTIANRLFPDSQQESHKSRRPPRMEL